jgi:transcriptional regulator GlxA family with amidase domain
MKGAEPHVQTIKVPAHGVVARSSTATYVTDSPGITAAVLHLREHFHGPVRLATLARVAGMSERVFESEFKRRVGRSAREEIQRARLAAAGRLLRDTDLKLDAVAVESGLGSARKLCAIFAEAYGATPTAWRQRAKQA